MNKYSNQISKIIQFHEKGKYLESKPLILEILRNDNNNVNFLKLLSFTELQIGNTNESIKVINKAISINKDIAEFYLIRGFSHMKNLDYEIALKDFEKSIHLNSKLKDAYLNIGVIYSEIKKFDQSINYLSKVIDLDPNDKRAYINLAQIRSEMNDYETALEEINKSIIKDPNNLNSYLLRGNFYKELKMFDSSLADFEKVITESEKINNRQLYHDALYNKSLLKLLLGDFNEGWKLYEHRFHIHVHKEFEKFKKEKIFSKIPKKNIPFPQNITDLKNSNLLIISEQGIGEHIIFLPLISEASKLAKSITVLIDARLIPLCERSFKNIIFLPIGDKNIPVDSINKKVSLLKQTNFDFQISVASLSKFFRKNLNDFKNTPNKFFIVNEKLKNDLKDQLSLKSNKNIIGISWKSFNSSLRHFKNIDLKQLGLIFKDLDITLINLQYGDVDDEINKFINDTKIPIINIKSFIIKEDLDSLLSLIDLCDLVISTDNITIRLSGSINKDTWVMLPSVPQFFYLLDRPDCLWHPSLKFYRQEKRGSWSSILLKIRDDLLKRYI